MSCWEVKAVSVSGWNGTIQWKYSEHKYDARVGLCDGASAAGLFHLFILLAFGADDEVDGDDEDEDGEENAGDDGDPVDGAEAAREPLRARPVDAGRLRGRPRRRRGRR